VTTVLSGAFLLSWKDFHRPGDFFHAFFESPLKGMEVHTTVPDSITQQFFFKVVFMLEKLK